jgi:hypothetical protein
VLCGDNMEQFDYTRAKQQFIDRDEKELNELQNSWHPITESTRLKLVEGRLNDLTTLVMQLLEHLGKQDEANKKTD